MANQKQFVLTRSLVGRFGAFGELKGEGFSCFTLEHSYVNSTGNSIIYFPKLPQGIYTAKRGQHTLHSGPIETFEVLGVPGHSGILFHRGNFQEDSEGCVLLGDRSFPDNPKPGITDSSVAFAKFLTLLEGVDEFQLEVK